MIRFWASELPDQKLKLKVGLPYGGANEEL